MRSLIILLIISCVYCNILVIGKAGVGKSYFINSLLGKNVARESETDDIGTTKIQEYEISGMKIYDTPGLFDVDSNPETVLRHYITRSDPILIIVCYDASERRLSQQDKELVSAIDRAAGNIMDQTIFVLTQVNRACSGRQTCSNILDSKKETLETYGAKTIILAGDKQDCLYGDCYNPNYVYAGWMENAWKVLISKFNLYNYKHIKVASKIHTAIEKGSMGYDAFQNANKNSGGCISSDSNLGGILAKDVNPGDMIYQNGNLVKVLFVYNHKKIYEMYEFTINDKIVCITGNHYIPINGQYIMAKDVVVDGYVTNIRLVYKEALYIVTELEDIYINDIPVSTYVWNYSVMKILHIPFRFILGLII